MYACEVLVFEKKWSVCWGQGVESKRALEILTRCRVVYVDGVGVEDVSAAGCSRVDVLVDFPGVEWGVVIVADGERDCVGSWRLKADSPAHKVLREGLLCVRAEVEASTTVATSKGPVASAPPSRRNGIVVVSAIVGRRHCFG